MTRQLDVERRTKRSRGHRHWVRSLFFLYWILCECLCLTCFYTRDGGVLFPVNFLLQYVPWEVYDQAVIVDYGAVKSYKDLSAMSIIHGIILCFCWDYSLAHWMAKL